MKDDLTVRIVRTKDVRKIEVAVKQMLGVQEPNDQAKLANNLAALGRCRQRDRFFHTMADELLQRLSLQLGGQNETSPFPVSGHLLTIRNRAKSRDTDLTQAFDKVDFPRGGAA